MHQITIIQWPGVVRRGVCASSFWETHWYVLLALWYSFIQFALCWAWTCYSMFLGNVSEPFWSPHREHLHSWVVCWVLILHTLQSMTLNCSCGCWAIQSSSSWDQEDLQGKWPQHWGRPYWCSWVIMIRKSKRSKSWTTTSALSSSWSMLVQSLRFSRTLCVLGVMSFLWLIDTDLEWNSSTRIRHLFDVLSMLLRLCTRHITSSKQGVEVRIE